MEKLVSVIIPVYNKEKYLRICLESVMNQSYSNIEIIVIDDGSTDNSSNIIEKMKLKDKRIRYYSQRNLGVSSARNKGIDLALGEYLFFLDADDKIKKQTISLLINESIKCSADIVVSNFTYSIENKEIKKTYYKQEHIKGKDLSSLQTKADMFLLNGRPLSSVCNKLYNVNFIRINNIRFRDQILAEDRMFNLECYLKAPKISIIEENTYFINIVNNSRSRSINKRYYNESINSVFILDRIFKIENNKDDELIQLTLITEIEKILNYYYINSRKKFTKLRYILKLINSDRLLNSIIKDLVRNNTLTKINGNKKMLFRLHFFSKILEKGLVSILSLSYISYKIISNSIKR